MGIERQAARQVLTCKAWRTGAHNTSMIAPLPWLMHCDIVLMSHLGIVFTIREITSKAEKGPCTRSRRQMNRTSEILLLIGQKDQRWWKKDSYRLTQCDELMNTYPFNCDPLMPGKPPGPEGWYSPGQSAPRRFADPGQNSGIKHVWICSYRRRHILQSQATECYRMLDVQCICIPGFAQQCIATHFIRSTRKLMHDSQSQWPQDPLEFVTFFLTPRSPTPVAVTSKRWISQVRRFRYYNYNTSWFEGYSLLTIYNWYSSMYAMNSGA